MKKFIVVIAAAAFSLSACPVLSSCSPGGQASNARPQGVYGEITDYFSALLKGEKADMPDISGLTPDDNMASCIWDLYAYSVKHTEAALPDPFDLIAKYKAGTLDHSGVLSLSNGESMSYTLAYKGDKPAAGWPLFINLHGSGDSAKGEFEATFAWSATYRDSPSLYFIPQSPKGGTGCRWFQPSRQKAWESIIRAAYVSGNVNPDKIYMMGISEGAYGTQRLCGYYADYLAGVGPIAGGEPMYSFAPANTANIFYCARTGELDTMYGRLRCTRKAQELWDKMAQEHPGYYEHYIDIMAGAGHSLYVENPKTYGYDGITAKLIEHRRNPYPKYVYWENYALGNINGESYRCREGFYNLRVLEGQNGNTDGNVHDAYEMTIEGNTITLNVYSVTVTPAELVSEDGWTMNVDVERTSVPAATGKVRIYLNSKLVDMNSPVTVIVNGRTAFEGKADPSVAAMIESAALFFDPARVFPASVDVEVRN